MADVADLHCSGSREGEPTRGRDRVVVRDGARGRRPGADPDPADTR